MNEAPEPAGPRATLRTSWLSHCFSALLLAAIAVLALRLASAASEESTLRRELTQLRAEGGHLDIKDPNKIYAVQIPSDHPHEWAWRIYLPPIATYQQFNYRGRMADPGKVSDPSRQQTRRAGSGGSGSIQSGEFVYRVKMEDNEKGAWVIKTIRSTGWSSMSQKPMHDWIAKRDWQETSDVPVGQQREFAADAVFELLRLRNESGVQATDPSGNTETVVVWIAPTNTKQ